MPSALRVEPVATVVGGRSEAVDDDGELRQPAWAGGLMAGYWTSS